MFSFTGSIILYMSTFIISSLILYIYERRANNFWLIVGVLPPTILSSLRYNVGTDYLNYYNVFERIQYTDMIDVMTQNSSYEIGFRILSKIILLFTENPQITFGVLSFITILITLVAYKNLFGVKMISLFYFIYLLSLFPASLNIVRQSLAVSIVFFGINYLYNNELTKYVITIVIASTMHSSALISLVFLLIKLPTILDYIKKKPISIFFFLITILFITLFILQGNLSIYTDKFMSYFESGTDGGILSNTLDLFLLLILLLHSKQLNKNELSSFLLKFSSFYLLFVLIGYQSVIFLRFKSYLGWLPIVLIFKSISLYKEKKVILLFIILFYVFMFIISSGIQGHGEVIPYKFKIN